MTLLSEFLSIVWWARKSVGLSAKNIQRTHLRDVSYKVLIRHRFASHVCQTLFAIAKDTVNREVKNSVVLIIFLLKAVQSKGVLNLSRTRRASHLDPASVGYLRGVPVTDLSHTLFKKYFIGGHTGCCLSRYPSICISRRSELARFAFAQSRCCR